MDNNRAVRKRFVPGLQSGGGFPLLSEKLTDSQFECGGESD